MNQPVAYLYKFPPGGGYTPAGLARCYLEFELGSWPGSTWGAKPSITWG